jgi:hypothetical protein
MQKRCHGKTGLVARPVGEKNRWRIVKSARNWRFRPIVARQACPAAFLSWR